MSFKSADSHPWSSSKVKDWPPPKKPQTTTNKQTKKLTGQGVEKQTLSSTVKQCQIFKIAMKDSFLYLYKPNPGYEEKRLTSSPTHWQRLTVLMAHGSRLTFSSTCSALSYPLVYLHNYSASSGCAGAARTPAPSRLGQKDHTEGQPRLHKEKPS